MGPPSSCVEIEDRDGAGGRIRSVAALVCYRCGQFLDGSQPGETGLRRRGSKPRLCLRCSSFGPPAPPRRKTIAAARPVPPLDPLLPPETTLVGTTLFERYRVLKMLPGNERNEIYLAYDTQLGRDVVVKFLTQDIRFEHVERFKKEGTLMAALRHPNVASVLDFGVDRSRPFIITEYIEGFDLESYNQTLAQLQDEAGRIRRLLEVGLELARALDVVHAEGIVHLDLKPQNVRVDRTGRPVLIDFGIARKIWLEQTRPGPVEGTMYFMSPEQLRQGPRARVRIDHRSDIYSLCALFYYLLAGRVPFPGPSPVDVLRQIEGSVPRRPSEINPALPVELDEILLRGLDVSPDARFQSMSELAMRLEPVLAGPFPRRGREGIYERHRLKIALALCAAAVLIPAYQLVTFGGSGGTEEEEFAHPPRATRRWSATFGEGVIGSLFLPVSGEVAVSKGRLLMQGARLVSSFELAASDDLELELDVHRLVGPLAVIAWTDEGNSWEMRIDPSTGTASFLSGGQEASARMGHAFQEKEGLLRLTREGRRLTLHLDGQLVLRFLGPNQARPARVLLEAGEGPVFLTRISVTLGLRS